MRAGADAIWIADSGLIKSYTLAIDNIYLELTERTRKPFVQLALERGTVYMTAFPLNIWAGGGTPGGRAI